MTNDFSREPILIHPHHASGGARLAAAGRKVQTMKFGELAAYAALILTLLLAFGIIINKVVSK